jgi:C-terminal peptidase prc
MLQSKSARLLTLLLLWGLFFTPPAAATTAVADDTDSQSYVVLVGIGNYQDPQILPRKHAEADAKALYDVFTNKDYLGVDPSHIKLLLGTPDPKRNSQPATRENILKALAWATKNAKKEDLVILAFIGQGAPLGERSCYFTTDSTFKDRAKNALAAIEIEHALEALKSHRFCAFLDVNFNGFDRGKEPTPDPNLGNFYKEFLGKDDDTAPPINRVIFLPNNGLKASFDLPDQGVFTRVVADGLKGKADHEGYEPDGLITVDELIKYVRKEIPDLTRKHAKADEDKGQQPVVLEYHISDFVIDRNPAVTAEVARRRAAFQKLATEQKLSKEQTEEGLNLLTKMPKLEAQQELRKAYQKLADGKLTLAEFQTQRTTLMAGMRLPEGDALTYARTVIRATEVVKDMYFKSVSQGQMVESAIRGMYKKLDEKVPSSFKERLDNVKNLTSAQLEKLLSEARLHLGKREDLDGGKDITLSLQPMLAKLDRHTDYVDPETVKRSAPDLYGTFTGIGVQIRKSHTKDMLQVVTPIRGSPAYNAKIYTGDIITTIVRETDSEGNPLAKPEVLSTKGMSTEDAVKKIIGKEGTRVKLIIEREGAEKPLEFNLMRGRVETESAVGHKRNADDDWDYVIDPENRICYVRLTSFQKHTYRDLEKVMRKLSKAGIKGFILDLRFNPGGLLDSAVKISDLFIDDGMIVSIRPRTGAEISYIGKHDGSYTAFPMVCLVNGYSASGSEIVAACLQDHNRAVIIGSRSWGKGSVQTILPFDTGGKLKITTATFWRPNGKNLHKASTQGREEDEWGVSPHTGYVLNLPTKELYDLQDHLRQQEVIARPDRRATEARPGFRDRQLDLALEYLRNQIKAGNGKASRPAG